jgi:hypothetical protein
MKRNWASLAHPTGLDAVFQGHAIELLPGNEVATFFPDVVDGAKVRMVLALKRPGLRVESG